MINTMKMIESSIIKNVNFNNFRDEFGNVKQEFEVIRFDKRSNGKWIEEERRTSGGSYFILENKLYCKCDNSLLSMNMDFESKSCGACFQIGKDIINDHKITGNEILFTCKAESKHSISLHKQSYSNNTCFYTLKDANRNWKLNYGSDNIIKLIESVTYELKYNLSLKDQEAYKTTDAVKKIIDDEISFNEDILNNLNKLL